MRKIVVEKMFPSQGLLRLFFREGVLLLLVVGMVGLAILLDEKEIIFPELAAIALGSWVIVKRVWFTSRWRTLFALTAAGLAGTLLQLYSPLPLVLNIAIGFSAVMVLLILLRSSLYPAISACLLPLVLGHVTWRYPLIVFVLVFLLLGVQWLMERVGWRASLPFHPILPSRRVRLRQLLILLPIVLAMVILAEWLQQRFLILPPLIVLFVEFSKPGTGLRKAPFTIIGLVTVAALLGNIGLFILERAWGFPPILAVGITTLLLLLIFMWGHRYFAPAMAILILPQIVESSWYLFPLEVMLSSALFIALAFLFFREKPERQQALPRL